MRHVSTNNLFLLIRLFQAMNSQKNFQTQTSALGSTYPLYATAYDRCDLPYIQSGTKQASCKSVCHLDEGSMKGLQWAGKSCKNGLQVTFRCHLRKPVLPVPHTVKNNNRSLNNRDPWITQTILF